MLILTVVLAALVVLMLVARPFWQPEGEIATAGTLPTPGPIAPDAEAPAGNREIERERALGALAELEYDFQMQKLSVEDYEQMRAELSRRAAVLTDEPAPAPGAFSDGAELTDEQLDALIDQEVAAELAREAGVPTADRAAAPAAARFCVHCGARLIQPGQRFCQECGGRLS